MRATSSFGPSFVMAATLVAGGCWHRGLPTIEPTPGSGNSNGTGGAPGSGVIVPHAPISPDKLDVLFMIDDSASMAPLQVKLGARVSTFVEGLVDPATGLLPNLHIGVVSSSFGGGAWGNVNQCHAAISDPSTLGDDRGRLLQGAVGPDPSPCNMLHSGTKFLANMDAAHNNQPNYDGDIRDAFRCIALLGDRGCGFESQFESIYYALYKGTQADDPDNAGFVRPDARLAIVMFTNEDDCSVRGDSLLLAPAVNSVADPTGLGALASYRCNEFGHLCGGLPPPHEAAGLPASGLTLNACVSAENSGKTDPAITDPNGQPDPTMGHLWPTVAELSAFVKMFKTDPRDIFVAAIAGPTTDAAGNSLYRVVGHPSAAPSNEILPTIAHSCVQTTTSGAGPEYADPAVRIKQWVDSFGANGAFYPICADDFATTMGTLAGAIHQFQAR